MIILTDYPKIKTIPANLRGLSNEELLRIKNQMDSLMMNIGHYEAGGYFLEYSDKDVEAELQFRSLGR